MATAASGKRNVVESIFVMLSFVLLLLPMLPLSTVLSPNLVIIQICFPFDFLGDLLMHTANAAATANSVQAVCEEAYGASRVY